MGATGATGPYYDIIEFDESGEITDTVGTYNTVVTTYKDSRSVLSDFTSPNVRGPRGPMGAIEGLEDAVGDIIINIDPNIIFPSRSSTRSRW